MDPISSVGNVVTGVIEGKFEHGYLVTVLVGSERLKGVIYHIPPGPARCPQHAYVPNFSLSLAPSDVKLPETIVPEKERKRKQREELKKDPNAPRPSRTGYNFFFAEERAKLKRLYPDKERELSRMIGDAWNGLTEEQKMVNQISPCFFVSSYFQVSFSSFVYLYDLNFDLSIIIIKFWNQGYCGFCVLFHLSPP